MNSKIKDYLNKFDLDIRKSKSGRYIDQKVTPDVLSFIADCVCNYISEDLTKDFSVKDIWESQYFIKNVRKVFSKPSPENKLAYHEYDKFIAQPIKTLEYAKILKLNRKAGASYFRVKNFEILEYIALKERNAFIFLNIYLSKVLGDSGFMKHFNRFIALCKNNKVDTSDFSELKGKFQKFTIGNTPINTEREVNRIFPKVINIFAAENNIQGTIKGRLSKRPIYYLDLMYNRINFRDIDKEKKLTRKEALALKKNPNAPKKYNNYLIEKAKARIKNKYQVSEVKDEHFKDKAHYVHHIFPKNEFPKLAAFLENLIKLTATQHFTKAHPNGKTIIINKDYQMVCLIWKSESIEKSLLDGELFYSKPNFVFVVNTGLKLESNEMIKDNLNFEKIREKIKMEYKK